MKKSHTKFNARNFAEYEARSLRRFTEESTHEFEAKYCKFNPARCDVPLHVLETAPKGRTQAQASPGTNHTACFLAVRAPGCTIAHDPTVHPYPITMAFLLSTLALVSAKLRP
jgi:hypothetical protein